MTKMKKTGMLFLLFLLLGAGSASAESRYVSDQLILPLRGGQSERHKILKLLKTGTKVELLEEHEEFFLIRIEDGTEGFVQKQYLTADTPKPYIIARLEKEKTKLQERIKQLEAKHSDLQTVAASAQQTQAAGEGVLAERERELIEIRGQYQDLLEKSKGVVELSAERDRLKTQNDRLTTEVATLRRENEQVLYSGAIKWFLAGGGVLLLGWLIGSSSRKKKKAYSF